MKTQGHGTVRKLAVGIAVAALAAPAAQAGVDKGMGVAAYEPPAVVETGSTSGGVQGLPHAGAGDWAAYVAETRGKPQGLPHAGPSDWNTYVATKQGTPRGLPHAGPRDWSAYVAANGPSATETTGRFDWADAGVGAVIAIGAALLAAAALVGARRRERTVHA